MNSLQILPSQQVVSFQGGSLHTAEVRAEYYRGRPAWTVLLTLAATGNPLLEALERDSDAITVIEFRHPKAARLVAFRLNQNLNRLWNIRAQFPSGKIVTFCVHRSGMKQPYTAGEGYSLGVMNLVKVVNA